MELSSISSHSTTGLSMPPMWLSGAQTFRVATVLIVAIEMFSSWVSRGNGPVQMVCHCVHMGQACSLTTHWVLNQCLVSVPPQLRSRPRTPTRSRRSMAISVRLQGKPGPRTS